MHPVAGKRSRLPVGRGRRRQHPGLSGFIPAILTIFRAAAVPPFSFQAALSSGHRQRLFLPTLLASIARELHRPTRISIGLPCLRVVVDRTLFQA
jgi:hypothetical protein